jgi:FHA domain
MAACIIFSIGYDHFLIGVHNTRNNAHNTDSLVRDYRQWGAAVAWFLGVAAKKNRRPLKKVQRLLRLNLPAATLCGIMRSMAESSFRLRIGERDIPLRPGETTLGRSEECTMLLDDALLSRVHARLRVSGSEVVLEDLDSKNGTYVNDVRIQEPARLHNGDRLRLGHTLMELQVIRRRARSSQSQIRTLGFSTQVDFAPPGGDPSDVVFRMLKMGRLDEAAKLLKSRAAQLTATNEPLPANHLMSRTIQEGLLGLTERSMDGIWLHRLFKLHVHCDWFMAADVQQKAEQLIRAVGQLGGDGLIAYISHWAAKGAELSAVQQRQLDRLGDLARRDR